MKILELHSQYLAILSEIEDMGGEITADHEAKIEAIGSEIIKHADKADFVFRKLDAESEFYAAEIKRLQAFKGAIDNANERLRDYVKMQMQALSLTKIEGEKVSLTLSKVKPKVVVDDESKLDNGYFEVVTTKKLSKTKLSEDLALGPVEGAHLEQNYALRITRSKK